MKIIFLLAYVQLSIMSFFHLMDWILSTSGMGKTLCCDVKDSFHFNAIPNKAFPGMKHTTLHMLLYLWEI